MITINSSGSRCVMEIDTTTQVKKLNGSDCISHCINTFVKGTNPIILLPAIGKL